MGDWVKAVIEEYQEKIGDIDYTLWNNTDKYGVLLYDWDEVHTLNAMLGEVLLEKGEITKEELEETKNDKYNTMWIESAGLNYGFTDEYFICGDCGHIRPNLDNYKQNMIIYMGDFVCGDCCTNNPQMYLDYLRENPVERLNIFLSEKVLTGFGYKKLDGEYENGLYDKQDDPHQIYKKLKEKYNDIIFSSTYSSPFTIEFEVFVKN